MDIEAAAVITLH